MSLIDEIIDRSGDFFIVGLPGAELDNSDTEFLESFRPGGVILFERNIIDPVQLKNLCEKIESIIPDVFICADQEGGRVARLPEPFTQFPPASALGFSGSRQLALEAGEAMALELKAAGINFDFAPVLDLATNKDNEVIGDRAFGSDPQEVAALGKAFIKGMQSTGILACAKHFPGHGDTETDSHLDLPVILHKVELLKNREWVPFITASNSGVAAIMTAHIIFSEIDKELPATLSPGIISLIRSEIGHQGLIITDDLEMKAISKNFSVADASLKAISAGVNMSLICHERSLMFEAREMLVESLAKKEISVDQMKISLSNISDAKDKIKSIKESSGKHLSTLIGCQKHRILAEKIASYLT